MITLTTRHFLKNVIINIVVIEILLFVILSFLSDLTLSSHLFYSFLLSIVIVTVFYFFFYKPSVSRIDEQRKAEIENQKVLFEQSFFQSCTSTQILDKDGWCLRINPKLSEIFGVKPENIEGRVYNIFQDEEIRRQGIDIILRRVFDELKIEEWEIYFDIGISADSQGVPVDEKKKEWFSCKAYPIVDSKGKLLNVVIQHECITDRKIAETELKDSETRFRELFNRAPVGYHELDEEGRIVRVNQTELDLLGYKEEEMLGSKVWEFSVEDQLSQQAVMAKIAGTLSCEHNIERIYRRKDGTTIHVLINDMPLYNHDGRCTGIRTAIQDNTERKRYEDEIHRINKEMTELLAAKDKFLSIIAHDLRNPFTTIIGFSDILKEEIKNLHISTAEEYAEIISSSGRQAINLLESLLEWGKIIQGQVTYNPVRIQLKDLVSEITFLLKESARLKNIGLYNLIPDHLTVHADKEMMKTLFRNLVSNAIKFTFPGGKIEITSKENLIAFPNQVVVSVKDNGIGIKPEHIDKIFNIGDKHVAMGTKNEKGTGLGLIFCKEFVEKHGGKIWLESDPSNHIEGHGTIVKFSLPKS